MIIIIFISIIEFISLIYILSIVSRYINYVVAGAKLQWKCDTDNILAPVPKILPLHKNYYSN